jgi:hypothetical protein
MTRTSSGVGRGRCIARLIVAEIPPVPQARNWKTASIGNPRASQNRDRRNGMTRDCGGNPGHETTCISRSNQGASTRCSERVTFTSNAWLRFRLTKANNPPKTASAVRPNAIAPRPRASARRGGKTSRTVRRPVGVSMRTAGLGMPSSERSEVVNLDYPRVQLGRVFRNALDAECRPGEPQSPDPGAARCRD